MSNMLTKNNYNALDLFKLVCAYLIIILHVPPLMGVGETIVRQTIVIIAVPFFFCASGYLASAKLNKDFNSAFNCSLKNWKLYLIWTVIYLPLIILGWVQSEKGIDYNLVLFFRDFIFEGSYLTIWFLNALASAFLIEYLLLKIFKPKTCFILSIIVYVVACLLSSYNQLLCSCPFGQIVSNTYYSIFATTKNGFLFGFPFVSLGVFIASTEKKSLKFNLIASIVSFILLIIEVLLRNKFFPLSKSVDFALCLVPFTFFLLRFVLSIQLKDKFVKQKNLYVYLRKLSILLFLTQRIFIFIFNAIKVKIIASFNLVDIFYLPIIEFVLVAGCTTLFSMAIIKLSEKRPILRKIY